MKKPLALAVALVAAALLSSWALRAQDPHQEEVSALLRQLYEDDQAARTGLGATITPEEVAAFQRADEERRQEVLAIVADGLLATGDDHFHAAMILQHGGQPEDYLLSHVLATVGGFEGNQTSRWLAAASLDRFLQSIERPQVFGTQYRRDADQAWTQEPLDGDLFTNAVRQRYGVPGLAAAAQRLEQMNR